MGSGVEGGRCAEEGTTVLYWGQEAAMDTTPGEDGG